MNEKVFDNIDVLKSVEIDLKETKNKKRYKTDDYDYKDEFLASFSGEEDLVEIECFIKDFFIYKGEITENPKLLLKKYENFEKLKSKNNFEFEINVNTPFSCKKSFKLTNFLLFMLHRCIMSQNPKMEKSFLSKKLIENYRKEVMATLLNKSRNSEDVKKAVSHDSIKIEIKGESNSATTKLPLGKEKELGNKKGKKQANSKKGASKAEVSANTPSEKNDLINKNGESLNKNENGPEPEEIIDKISSKIKGIKRKNKTKKEIPKFIDLNLLESDSIYKKDDSLSVVIIKDDKNIIYKDEPNLISKADQSLNVTKEEQSLNVTNEEQNITYKDDQNLNITNEEQNLNATKDDQSLIVSKDEIDIGITNLNINR